MPTDPFQTELGLHSELSILWTTEIDAVRLQVDPSVWINNVLPGFGIDNVRLVEVVFPPGLPVIGNAAKVFDDAQRAFHAGRYEDCIGKCRGIIRAWNEKLGATSKQRLAALVSNAQKWPEDDPRQNLLDSIWQAVSYQPTAHDARFHLTMTAVVSEYLHQVLRQ